MRPRSATVTTRFWLTSPTRNPIRTVPEPMPPPTSATLLTSTVTYCASVTPVNGTIISLPLNVGAPAVAVPSVTNTVPAAITALWNVNTIEWDGPARGSVVGLANTTPSGRSNVPAAPCTLRAANGVPGHTNR